MRNKIKLEWAVKPTIQELCDLSADLPEDATITHISTNIFDSTVLYYISSKKFIETPENQDYPKVLVEYTGMGCTVDLSDVLMPTASSEAQEVLKFTGTATSRVVRDEFPKLGQYKTIIRSKAGEIANYGIEISKVNWDAANNKVEINPISPDSFYKTSVCTHQWKQHTGLFESFTYCEKCDERK